MDSWEDKLNKAVLKDDVASVKKLLKRQSIENIFYNKILKLLFRSGPQRNSILHVAAYANSVKVTEMLIANGQDVNCVNILGNTPLHIAAQYNSWEVADLLISHGAKINAVSNEGKTPLDVAVAYGNKHLIELLKLTQEKICSGPDMETNRTTDILSII